MSDTIPSPEQRVASAAALIDKFSAELGPDPKATALGVKPGAPAGQTPDIGKTDNSTPASTAESKPSFADAIKEMRARREKQAAEAQRQSQWEAENARLKQELEAVKGSGAFEDDPVGYAKSRKWTPEQQFLYAKSLMFDLAPEKADPDFRIKMFEDKQKRDESAKKAQEEQTRAQREAEENRRMMMDYAAGMESAVMGFDAGTYPASEVEYGDDAEGYLGSLLSEAHRMADAAAKEGRVADLTPVAVARSLEAKIAARDAAREKRRAGRQAPAQSPAPVTQSPPAQTPARPAAEQSGIDTMSTKNMGGSGTPLPPALTEKERIQRAVAAGWGGR